MSHEILPKIWHWYPQKQTRFSSLWWFFLLFPEQEKGYGPQQLMFTVVSPVGQQVQVNKTPHRGLPLRRGAGAAKAMEEPFPAYLVGWMHSGQQMYEGLLQETGMAQVEAGRGLRLWTPEGYGGEIVPCTEHDLALSASFQGPRGGGEFRVWGDPASEMTSPVAAQRETIAGGANVLAWRHLRFQGAFTSPEGRQSLSGVGYFQRVCLDIVPFPWKWMWAVFADGSFFSCFVPYLGPHLLRRGDRLFPRRLENLTLPMRPSAYFCRHGSWETVHFEQVQVDVHTRRGQYPHFLVNCRNEGGDFLKVRAAPYAHNQVLLERPLLQNRLWSCYNYNEYLFRTAEVSGRIGGRPLRADALSPGYGNCEYTWGLGL